MRLGGTVQNRLNTCSATASVSDGPVAATMQETHEADAHYGNFRWYYEDAGVIDLNAVEFALDGLNELVRIGEGKLLRIWPDILNRHFRHRADTWTGGSGSASGRARISRSDGEIQSLVQPRWPPGSNHPGVIRPILTLT